MPSLSTFAVFAAAAIALIALPGPNMMYILTTGIGHGRRAALASAAGVEVGALLHVGAAALGVSALIRASALAFNVVKYLGAAYLVYLGIRTLTTRLQTDRLEKRPPAMPYWRLFRRGLVVNLLNAKVSLFFLAFLPQFVEPSRGSATRQILVLGIVFFLIALAMDAAYALAAGSVGAWLRRRPGFAGRQKYVTGSIYLALGLSAAFASGRHDSR